MISILQICVEEQNEELEKLKLLSSLCKHFKIFFLDLFYMCECFVYIYIHVPPLMFALLRKQ